MKKRLLILPLAAMLLGGCGETPSPQSKPDDPSPVVPTKTLSSIEIATKPTKVEYKEGETFDPAGMVVNAVYSDETKEAVTDYLIPDLVLTVDTTKVTITYQGKTADVKITVVPAKTLTGIEITTKPTKVEYKEEEIFDPTGIVVSAVYSDETKVVITDYQVPDLVLTVDATKVTIAYQGKTADVAITVIPLARYTITFMKSATETIKIVEYKEGEQPSCSYSVPATAEYTYKMLGWSLSPDGEVLSSLPVASKDATYYAIVQATKNKYTIDFELNCEAEGVDITAEYGTRYDNFDDVIPENDGYKFAGWYLDSEFKTPVSFPLTLTKDITVYAKWTEKIDIVKYLKLLLGFKDFNPYSFIPETMRPDYEANFVEASDILNYETTQSVSNIKTTGFGEQWEMVLENISQSEKFYTVLGGVDNIFTNAIGALVTHFTENPDSQSGKKTTETFEASASYKDGVLSVGVEFKKDISIPVLGSLKPVINMTYAVKTAEKTMKISLNDENKLKCKFGEDEYVFGISYGLEIAGKTGIRTAYCQLNKDDQDYYEGHIYEYFSYMTDEKVMNLIKSSADFYADYMYCSVIGNKASGLVAFNNVINELYDIKTGHLEGYMVEEEFTKKFPIIGEFSTIYHTFWFNLEDINNIFNIKATPNGKVDPSDNHCDVYLNNSAKVFEPVHNKKLGVETSRHNDVEMRDHYYYGLNDQNEVVKYETQIPMLFVQDDDKYYMDEEDAKNQNFTDFSSDMATSGINNCFVKLNRTIYEKIREDCQRLGPVYKENKELVTPEAIIEWLSE